MALALLFASILLGVYYAALRPVQEGYMTVYLLDSQKNAFDYPERLVNGGNSTFSVYVEVENHMGNTTDFQVQLKVTSDMNPTFPVYGVNPVQTYNGTLKDGDTWENMATVSLNQAGDYMVIFELWIRNEKTGVLQFYNEPCVLNVQVL